MSISPLNAGNPSDLYLCRRCACCNYLCEVLRASVCCVWKAQFPWCSPFLLWLTISVTLLSHNSLHSERWGLYHLSLTDLDDYIHTYLPTYIPTDLSPICRRYIVLLMYIKIHVCDTWFLRWDSWHFVAFLSLHCVILLKASQNTTVESIHWARKHCGSQGCDQVFILCFKIKEKCSIAASIWLKSTNQK